MWPAVALTGVYGGYFGAAQGVLLMAVLGIGIDETLQRLNAVKNVLAAVVNGVAGLLFVVVADVDWRIVALIGVGSVMGGQLGATVGRRLPSGVLRVVIVTVGLVALVGVPDQLDASTGQAPTERASGWGDLGPWRNDGTGREPGQDSRAATAIRPVAT